MSNDNMTDTTTTTTGLVSPESAAILHKWVREAMRTITDAYGQSSSWYARTERRWRREVDGELTNAALIAEMIRRVLLVADESGFDLDDVLDYQPAYVEVENPDDPEGSDTRDLTLRETIDAVRLEMATALREAELIAAERAARAERKALRAAKGGR